MDRRVRRYAVIIVLLLSAAALLLLREPPLQRLMYVASARKNIYVYDIDKGHKHVRTLPIEGLRKPRGIAADATTSTLYVTFKETVVAVDAVSGRERWRRRLEASPADRLDVTPDGTRLFVPSGLRSQGPYWYVLNAQTGETIKEIPVAPGSHNTIVSLDGKRAYLASLKYKYLTVLSTDTLEVLQRIGPFAGFIRPFTIDFAEEKVYANVQNVLGYQTADLKTGKVYPPVASAAQNKREPHHATPSHGIALTPDNREIWVTDSAGDRLLVYDTAMGAERPSHEIAVGADPGWIAFDIDGRYAYPSTGEIIDAASKRIVGHFLNPDDGSVVVSEKMMELRIRGDRIAEAGKQFGIGRTHGNAVERQTRL